MNFATSELVICPYCNKPGRELVLLSKNTSASSDAEEKPYSISDFIRHQKDCLQQVCNTTTPARY